MKDNRYPESEHKKIQRDNLIFWYFFVTSNLAHNPIFTCVHFKISFSNELFGTSYKQSTVWTVFSNNSIENAIISYPQDTQYKATWNKFLVTFGSLTLGACFKMVKAAQCLCFQQNNLISWPTATRLNYFCWKHGTLCFNYYVTDVRP